MSTGPRISLLAIAAVTVVVAVGASPGRAISPPASPASGLTSLTLTSVGPDGKPADAASTQAAIAANGRYVAFESQAALATTREQPGQEQQPEIYLRDLIAGTTTRVSDPADGAATAPGISASGRLVSYEQDGDVYVADRQAAGSAPLVRQVTGTPRDLADEHVVPCPAALNAGRVTPCGPRLSADGTTLIYPAELSPTSPDLSVTAASGDGNASAVSGDMLDLTPYSPGGPYGSAGGSTTVRYENTGDNPVRFTGIAVSEPPGFGSGEPFELGRTSCTSALGPGSSCTVRVSYAAGTCAAYTSAGPQLLEGHLITNSAGPAGQSVLELTALCYATGTTGLEVPGGRGAATAAYFAGTGCAAPPDGLPLAAAPGVASDNAGAPLSDMGAAEIGRPYLVWLPVRVPAAAVTAATVVFADADCGIQLVDPAGLKLADPLPAGAPAACGQDEELASPAPPPPSPSPSPSASASASAPWQVSARVSADLPSSCTAYLLIDPDAVAPDAAFLGTVFEQPYVGLNVAPTAYLTTQGVRHLIVARTDPSGAGNFAISASTVVSVTGQGTELPGATEPSVSANGQYVGFAAPAPIGTAGTDASQVWLRDTGSDDTGSDAGWGGGTTTLVSCLPQARPGPCQAAPDAGSPSVSGDGQQVAFATTGGTSQIYVRSVPADQTVLVSAALSGGRGGNGPSYAPAITQDGAFVGYVSQATDLTRTPAAAGTANLYLAPTAGGPSELVSASGASLPAGATVGIPSVDAIGRLTVFPATGALLPGAPPGVASVYTFDRLPRLWPAPGSAGFGPVLLDSGTRAIRVTVTDGGPGPGTVTAVSATGPFRVTGNRCAGMVLSGGGGCAVTVTFAPTAPGRATGTLTITTQNDSEPAVTGTMPVAASVPAPEVTASPAVASAGEAVLVTGTGFPPGQAITLSWQPGLGSATAAASGSGTLGAYLVIFPDDLTGPRTLTAAGTAGVLAKAPFLVQQGAVEPPFSAGVIPR